MLSKGVYHQENQKIRQEFQHLFKGNHSWPWPVPLRVSCCVPVALRVSWLVLHWGHTHAIICNYSGLRQQMHEKSSLQIISTYRWSSYLRHDMSWEKLKDILSSYWVSIKSNTNLSIFGPIKYLNLIKNIKYPQCSFISNINDLFQKIELMENWKFWFVKIFDL